MKPDRVTNGSGDRITTTTSFAAVMNEGPEVGRLIRLRLVGIVVTWLLGVWWQHHHAGIPWLLHGAAAHHASALGQRRHDLSGSRRFRQNHCGWSA